MGGDDPLILLGEVRGIVGEIKTDVGEIKGLQQVANGRLGKAEKDIAAAMLWQTNHDRAEQASADRRKARRDRAFQVAGMLAGAGVLTHMAGAWQWVAHAAGLAK